jgi:hypothetical protein
MEDKCKKTTTKDLLQIFSSEKIHTATSTSASIPIEAANFKAGLLDLDAMKSTMVAGWPSDPTDPISDART